MAHGIFGIPQAPARGANDTGSTRNTSTANGSAASGARRKRRALGSLGAALILSAGAALAQGQDSRDYHAGSLTIADPHARPTAPAQRIGGAYLTLVNKGAADRLLGATTPVAASVQMHSMHLDGDVMRMREIAAIDLPAGQTTQLKPGGLHLMLVGLKAPLTIGQSFPMTLKFAKAGAVAVDVKVDAVGAASADAMSGATKGMSSGGKDGAMSAHQKPH